MNSDRSDGSVSGKQRRLQEAALRVSIHQEHSATDVPSRTLPRVRLGGSVGVTEAWLQCVLFANPTLLRGGDVDPAFADLHPVCMELRLDGGDGSRFLDILCLTPDGNIGAVEVKLSQNVESRRAVVAQVLEYAGALRRLTYADLEARVAAAVRQFGSGGPNGAGKTLYELAGGPSGWLDPEGFAAAIERNLSLGRILLLIAVDSAGPALCSLLEDFRTQPGLPFEIGLLELACYGLSDDVGSLIIVTVVAAPR